MPEGRMRCYMIWIAVAVIVLIGVWVYLVFPGKASREAKAPFEGRAFAHRGLYELDQSVPENSLPAFRRAVEAGYGAELDVQMTKDGQVVVFHDDDLKRGCGVDGRICDMTLEEVRKLRLFGTDEQIPLFSEVLEIFAGKQPLVVELKFAPNWKPLSDATRKMLGEYAGQACIESFHPFIVRDFRLNDPKRIRGQLSQQKHLYQGAAKGWQAFVLSRLLSNVLARPHFVAYCIGPKPVSVRLCEGLGAMKVCWTAREAEKHAELKKQYDVVIFEGYRPEQGPSETV